MRLWRQFTVSALFAGLALALVVLPAAAADEVDQEASALPSDGFQSWSGPDLLRQTFTPEQDTLTRVDLYFQTALPGPSTTGDVDVTVEVKRVGFGTVVASEILTVEGGFEAGWVTFDFPTAEILAGEQYAIEVSVDDDTQLLAWGWTNDDYAGGQAFFVSGGMLDDQTFDFLFIEYYEACGDVLFGTTPPIGGGFGTFALNCGTLEELVTASGCPEATATFFYNKPDGSFAVYIPGSEVAVVNAEFLGIFNGDPAIEETTIFTAKCV